MDRLARMQGKAVSQSLEWWFRQKYKLAPTDPRFLDVTRDDMLLDMYADYFTRNPNAEISETDDFEAEVLRFMEKDGMEDV